MRKRIYTYICLRHAGVFRDRAERDLHPIISKIIFLSTRIIRLLVTLCQSWPPFSKAIKTSPIVSSSRQFKKLSYELNDIKFEGWRGQLVATGLNIKYSPEKTSNCLSFRTFLLISKERSNLVILEQCDFSSVYIARSCCYFVSISLLSVFWPRWLSRVTASTFN